MESDPIFQSVAARDAAFCRLIKMIPRDVYYHTTTAEGLAGDEDEAGNRCISSVIYVMSSIWLSIHLRLFSPQIL